MIYVFIYGLGGYIYAQSVPGPFSVSGAGCFRWLPSPALEVNFFLSSGATDYAVDRRIFGASSWTRIITGVNNLPPGQGPLRLTDGGDFDDYTVAAGNIYEYQIIAINLSGQTASWNTAVVRVNQANCSSPIPPACAVSFSPSSILAGNSTTQSWTSAGDGDGSLSYNCTGNLGSGTLPASGSRTVSPATTQICTLTAVNDAGTSATCSAGVTVSSPLPPPPPPGPPPPQPPPPDITELFISNVRIINITTTTATVLWDTNKPADSQVEYCLNYIRCGTNTPPIVQTATNHTVNLSGLLPSTTYFIWVKSRDGAGNLAILGYFLFNTAYRTSPPPPGQPPPPQPPPPQPPPPPVVDDRIVISNIRVINITRDSATITWDTDRPADSRVYSCFWVFCFYSLAYDQNLTISHSLILTGLSPDTEHYIRVYSRDNSGAYGSSQLFSFKTGPGIIISNVEVTNITAASFTVSWATNYPADSRILACPAPLFFCFFVTPIRDPVLTLAHTMTVSNLSSRTDYYYSLTSVDPTGYYARTSFSSIKTN